MRTKAETRGASYIKYRLISAEIPVGLICSTYLLSLNYRINSGVTRGQPHQHTDKVRISG